jgi:hypothetical protein
MGDEDGSKSRGAGPTGAELQWMERLGYLGKELCDCDPTFVGAQAALQLLGYEKLHAKKLVDEYRAKFFYDDDEGRAVKHWPMMTDQDIGHAGMYEMAAIIHYVLILNKKDHYKEYSRGDFVKWRNCSMIDDHMFAVARGYCD